MKHKLETKWIAAVTIEKLEADGKVPKGTDRVDIFDTLTTGLCLRVTREGRKTWTFHYTAPGTKIRAREGLGIYDAVDLHTAREKAKEHRKGLDRDIDPKAVKAAERAGLTVAELIERRLVMEVRGKHRRAKDMEYRFKKYVTPIIGKVSILAFRVDPDYTAVIDPLRERNKMRMAGMVYRDLFGLFKFAFEEGLIEVNQMLRPKKPYTYVPRERWLPAEEIKTLWHSLPTALNRTPDVQRILKLLMATGQRSDEVCGITKDEIDLKNALWTLPKERAKNGEEHAIPLSRLAVQLLREAIKQSGDSKYVFPYEKVPGPKNSQDIATVIAYARRTPGDDQPLGKFGIPSWTAHDLRRTVATHMSMLGIEDHHISLVLNHRTVTKKTMTQKVYNKNTYLPQKRAAMEKWGDYLADLVGVQVGLKVVS